MWCWYSRRRFDRRVAKNISRMIAALDNLLTAGIVASNLHLYSMEGQFASLNHETTCEQLVDNL